MTKWKQHNVNKHYLELVQQRHSYKYKVTNGIRLLRKALERRYYYDDLYGRICTSFVINDTVFIDIKKCKYSMVTTHLKFKDGFIPFANIKKVELV